MTLHQLNNLSPELLREQLRRCCGATAWVQRLADFFPVANEEALLRLAHECWEQCTPADWREAFAHHPKIGDIRSLQEKFAATSSWAGDEQGAVRNGGQEVLKRLAAGNEAYEARFGYIFIVCATGKTAAEMLALLESRLPHQQDEEIRIAMQEQDKITQIRLQKLFAP